MSLYIYRTAPASLPLSHGDRTTALYTKCNKFRNVTSTAPTGQKKDSIQIKVYTATVLPAASFLPFLLWNPTLLKVAFVTDLKLLQQLNRKGPLEGGTKVTDQQQRQQTYVQRNAEAHSHNHWCRRRAVNYSAPVWSPMHPACNAHAPYYHLWPGEPLKYSFSHYLKKKKKKKT